VTELEEELAVALDKVEKGNTSEAMRQLQSLLEFKRMYLEARVDAGGFMSKDEVASRARVMYNSFDAPKEGLHEIWEEAVTETHMVVMALDSNEENDISFDHCEAYLETMYNFALKFEEILSKAETEGPSISSPKKLKGCELCVTLREELRFMSLENDNLNSVIEAHQKEMKTQFGELTEAREHVVELQKEKDDLESQIKALREQEAATTEEVTERQHRLIGEALAKVTVAEEQVRKLKEDLEKKEEEVVGLETALATQMEALMEAQLALSQVVSKRDKDMEGWENLESSLREREREIMLKDSKIRSLVDALEEQGRILESMSTKKKDPQKEEKPKPQIIERETELVKIFKLFDLDKSGHVTPHELMCLGQARSKVGQKSRIWTAEKNSQMISNMDQDSRDGQIDTNEFVTYFIKSLGSIDDQAFQKTMEDFTAAALHHKESGVEPPRKEKKVSSMPSPPREVSTEKHDEAAKAEILKWQAREEAVAQARNRSRSPSKSSSGTLSPRGSVGGDPHGVFPKAH